jgi:putative Holliday junction resolvase
MRVLALDYGTARCGCAISDPTGTLATPLEAVEPPDVARIAKLAADHDAERVVVGLPISLSGKEGEQARLTRAFAEQLGDLLKVPVETYDERMTTRLAAQSAREGARADEDSLAAAHLLESWLMAHARGAPGREAEEAPPNA